MTQVEIPHLAVRSPLVSVLRCCTWRTLPSSAGLALRVACGVCFLAAWPYPLKL